MIQNAVYLLKTLLTVVVWNLFFTGAKSD